MAASLLIWLLICWALFRCQNSDAALPRRNGIHHSSARLTESSENTLFVGNNTTTFGLVGGFIRNETESENNALIEGMLVVVSTEFNYIDGVGILGSHTLGKN